MQTIKQKLIVMAQEPWTNKDSVQGIDEKMTNLYYKRCNGTRPRAFIVTTIDVDAVQLPSNEEIILCSAYMPFDQNDRVPEDTILKIVEYSSKTGMPLIICADSNAHHILWGSSDINTRGIKLIEFIAAYELEILNKGTKPTFVTVNRREVLDITLVTQSFANRVKNWRVSDEETLSDHKEINFSVECDVIPATLFRNPRNTD